MKYFSALVLGTLLLAGSACERQPEPETDIREQWAGQYEIQRLTLKGVPQPDTIFHAQETIEVRFEADDSVTVSPGYGKLPRMYLGDRLWVAVRQDGIFDQTITYESGSQGPPTTSGEGRFISPDSIYLEASYLHWDSSYYFYERFSGRKID